MLIGAVTVSCLMQSLSSSTITAQHQKKSLYSNRTTMSIYSKEGQPTEQIVLRKGHLPYRSLSCFPKIPFDTGHLSTK